MFNLIIDNPVIYYLTASVVAIVIGIVLGNILLVTLIVFCIAIFYVRRIRKPKVCSQCNEVH
jgi:hypothetical protein